MGPNARTASCFAPVLFALLAAACTAPSSPGAAPGGLAPPTPPPPAPTIAFAPPAHPYAPALIPGVPHVRQKPDFCGEACVEMALGKLGRHTNQDQVFNASGLDPALGRGVYTAELRTALERLGFDPGPVFSTVNAASAAPEIEAQFAALHADLLAGIPSIVCMHYDDRPDASEHFRLILGYDPASDQVLYHEPAEDAGGYRRMPRTRFLGLWPLKYSDARWTLVRLRLDARALAPEPPVQLGFSPADFAQHVMALKKRIGPAFTVLVEPPFVVVGDEAPKVVEERAASTVRWTAERLKKDYFRKDPREILDVYLFKNRPSYEQHAQAFFGSMPDTPYGYYSSEHKALVMNIATGGGTLVHEIVHPFIEANFPECPPWFNEGLGSLYEQSGEDAGHIHGYPNWRLPGLQRAIKSGHVPSFKALTAMSGHVFYDEDRGTNYAQSRYLLYYLQERGLLVRYYQDFFAHRAEDPTGYASLKRVLGEEDIEAWKPRWETFVLGLAFP
ncbi:MAG: C39 family peptidase [Minicystis sp.]